MLRKWLLKIILNKEGTISSVAQELGKIQSLNPERRKYEDWCQEREMGES